MILAIRKEENGNIYIDKKISRFGDDLSILTQPPYNYKLLNIDEKYIDCCESDFNEDLTFNQEKYFSRKTIELSCQKIEEFKQKLSSLDYKTIKYTQGELSFEEFEKVKEECKNYRNEINSLENLIKNS